MDEWTDERALCSFAVVVTSEWADGGRRWAGTGGRRTSITLVRHRGGRTSGMTGILVIRPGHAVCSCEGINADAHGCWSSSARPAQHMPRVSMRYIPVGTGSPSSHGVPRYLTRASKFPRDRREGAIGARAGSASVRRAVAGRWKCGGRGLGSSEWRLLAPAIPNVGGGWVDKAGKGGDDVVVAGRTSTRLVRRRSGLRGGPQDRCRWRR